MYQVSFVILHYLSFEVTTACVDSILATYVQSDRFHFNIIIVDNASPNESFKQLSEKYSTLQELVLLQAPKNLGFAKGNNIGYLYATEILHSDFVIIANNDTEFSQTDFLENIITIYASRGCALIGPDILSTNGYHQNPYRPHPITDRELSRWLFNRKLWLCFLYADRYLHITKHISSFRNYYEKRSASGKPQNTWQEAHHDVVLQGACIIFTPIFIKSFPKYAFYPHTYMYCEEDILAYLCQRNGLSIIYTPSLQVLHKESVSTCLSHASQLDKDIYLTQNIVASLKIFKKLRKLKEIH